MSLLRFVITSLNRSVPKSLLKSARDGVDTLFKTQHNCCLTIYKSSSVITEISQLSIRDERMFLRRSAIRSTRRHQ